MVAALWQGRVLVREKVKGLRKDTYMLPLIAYFSSLNIHDGIEQSAQTTPPPLASRKAVCELDYLSLHTLYIVVIYTLHYHNYQCVKQ